MLRVPRCLWTSVCCLAIVSLLGCVTPTGRIPTRPGPDRPERHGAARSARSDAARTTGDGAAAGTARMDDRSASAEKRDAPRPAQETRREVQRLIESAVDLTFSSERADLLTKLAARPDVTAEDQIALIDAACRLGFSEHVSAVLLELAQNPVLTPGGRAYLRQHVDCITFSSQRKQVLDALRNAAPGAAG